MRRKLLTFLKVLIGVWVAELALLMYFHKYVRNEYTRPTLIPAEPLNVPDPEVLRNEAAFKDAKEAVLAAKYLTRGPNAGLEPYTLIDAATLDKLVEDKVGSITVWSTRLIAGTADRGLVAGEDFRDPDGFLIAGTGAELDFDKLLAMAKAYDGLEGADMHEKIRVKGAGSIVGFDLTMVFAGVNFLMLAAFLYTVLWGPVTRLLDERAQAVREDIDSARTRREEADQLRDEARGELKRVREGAEELREVARRKGEEERAAIVEDARDEARRTAERTQRAVEAEVERGRAAAAGEIGGLSVELAGKVLGRAVTPEDHKRLVQEFIKDLEKPPVAGEGAS